MIFAKKYFISHSWQEETNKALVGSGSEVGWHFQSPSLQILLYFMSRLLQDRRPVRHDFHRHQVRAKQKHVLREENVPQLEVLV